MKKILIGIATYNESKNITRLLKEIIINTKNESDILIVDDSSPDGTSNIVKKFIEENKNIFLIERRKKLGLGSAHKRIILFAQKNNYEKLITMDADFSHQPKEIPKLIRYSSNSNFVTGSFSFSFYVGVLRQFDGMAANIWGYLDGSRPSIY